MASNTTALDDLECSICSHPFREPKILDCLHIFCLECLQELRRRQSPGSTILTCPLCRKPTTFSTVADLPDNITLSAKVEEAKLQRQLQDCGSEVKCQACDDENNQAVSRCMDCDCFLCQECHKAHTRLPMMKSHQVYTLAQFRSGKVAYKSKLRNLVPKCRSHPGKSVQFYCSTCEQMVCMTCSVLHRYHTKPKHSLMDLSEASENCKQDVKELAAIAEKSKMELIATTSEADKCLQQLDSNFVKTSKKISNTADKKIARIEQEIARIRQEEKNLKQNAQEIYRDKIKPYKIFNARLDQVTQKLNQVNQFIAQASCHEILSLKQKLLQNLRELTEEHQEKVPERVSFMGFEEGERSLGRLVMGNGQKEKIRATVTCTEAHNTSKESHKILQELQTQKPKSGSEKTDFSQVVCYRKPTVDRAERLSLEDFEEGARSLGRKMPERDSDLESTDEAEESLRSSTECLKEKWQWTTQIKTFGRQQTEFKCAYKVAVFSNNELVVLDTTHQQLIKSSVLSEPKVVNASSDTLPIKDLNDPTCVAVNKSDHLIVLDGHDIKVFRRKKYQLLQQFTPGHEHSGTPTCLAVDDDSNMIAVGYKDKAEISLHKPDGSFIKTLHATAVGDHMTIYKQRILYTSYWDKKLIAIDYHGAKVFSADVTSDTSWGPHGVCCGKDGTIYVGVRGQGGTCELHEFSPDGKFIGHYFLASGVPWGITITKSGDNLLLTTGYFVKVCRRVQIQSQ